MSRKMRRQHWVDTGVQGTLIRRILFHWVAFFCVTLVCVSAMNLLLGDPDQSLVERVNSPGSGLMLIGVIMLALLPAFALDTIRFSNRFVGPIVRLRRCLRELGSEKSVPKLAFRDNDFWADVADEFNTVSQLVTRQREEIAQLKEQLGQVADESTATEKAPS